MKTVLIDGNSLLYRAFFALPTDMTTGSGQVTNAVYGFTSMLINLLRDLEPDRVAVAFDRPEPTFRHRALASYKAQRDETPELLVGQFDLVEEVLDSLGIRRISLVGFEADDVIATLATRSQQAGDSVVVVTGDRDSYQLVEDPSIKVLYNKRGVSDYVLYDESGIVDRTGVHPKQYVDYAALRGDPSDNLPGVPGVGEKTAAKLINAYGDVEGVIAHANEQTPKLRQNLVGYAQQARTNTELMRLVRDAPVAVELGELERPTRIDGAAVKAIFDLLEFRGLFERLRDVVEFESEAHEQGGSSGNVEPDREIVVPASPEAFVANFAQPERANVDLILDANWNETTNQPTALAYGINDEVVIVDPNWLADQGVAQAFGEFLSAGPVVGHDCKRLFRWLMGKSISVTTLRFDTKLAAYLLNPSDSFSAFDTGAESHVNEHIQHSFDFTQESESENGSHELATRISTIGRNLESLQSKLASQGMLDLLVTIEVPLVTVLARMEYLGVGVDVPELTRLGKSLTRRANELAELVQSDAGEPFNVNSTKQLRTILFDKLGLTPQKKTKTGYSTDAASLEKLRDAHPIVAHLLEYRELEKLRSTYAEGLLHEVREDGRIHATFNQTVARTGRLSSDRPNLHNIPVRSEQGRAFRRAFIPRQGSDFLVADYNQIELRCIAHLSGDPELVAAFHRGDDIHAAVAAGIFGVDIEHVTSAQRSKAKMVSYGLAYGMEAYGLAQRLGVEVSEASTILHSYFAAFPTVRSYMDLTVEQARAHGYTETLFGRRRLIPELASPNARLRAVGERQAMNSGIQGLAADIFKIALIRLDQALIDNQYTSSLILQVHDEVLVEVPPEEHEPVAQLVRDILSGAADLTVPLEVDLAFGKNWADAKG